ncbi:hypothetical protein DL95DRAFT_472752 [Leptodontidium sp. 2 PMI_412]|nr:hypothetical protein BKA61DRAFT_677005 [Leptodontidium sp. MPI-SDFR-AT-0119]KAH9203066.1 hypothetical protein DL95DRAFT_472752 [Leptodontidium sp. 2 PMI_412]
MFAHAAQAVLSFLLLATSITAAPIDVGVLEERQGSCMSALARPEASNNIGRVNIQQYIDHAEQATYFMNNFITVHIMPPRDIATTNHLTVEVSNSGSGSNTVIVSNYVNTLFSSQPREQFRVDIGPRIVSGGTITNSKVTTCLRLPRLDGTWFIQLQR